MRKILTISKKLLFSQHQSSRATSGFRQCHHGLDTNVNVTNYDIQFPHRFR